MNPIRVLHFVSSTRVDSGVMSIIMNIYRNIDRERIQFDFLYFDNYDNTFESEINALGGVCYKISRPRLSKSFFNELKAFFNEKNMYSILHNHEVYMNVIIAPIAKRYGVKNVIVHSHTTKFSDKKINSIRNKILCLPIKKQADYYFACSKLAGRFLYGDDYINKGKVVILNNAIECDKFKYDKNKRLEIRKKLELDGKMVVGHVGRFNEQKNHMFLIDIFNQICKLKSNAHLILIGDGPLENKIKEKVKILDLQEKVTFLGRRNDISDLMQAMDVFILPSLYEGLPLVGVEAQAAGLPCFMADTITDEVNFCDTKFFNLKNDSSIIAKQVVESLENFNREDTTIYIRENGYNIHDEVDKLKELYLKLVKS